MLFVNMFFSCVWYLAIPTINQKVLSFPLETMVTDMEKLSLKELAVPVIKAIDSCNYLLKSHHRRTAVIAYHIGKKMELDHGLPVWVRRSYSLSKTSSNFRLLAMLVSESVMLSSARRRLASASVVSMRLRSEIS